MAAATAAARTHLSPVDRVVGIRVPAGNVGGENEFEMMVDLDHGSVSRAPLVEAGWLRAIFEGVSDLVGIMAPDGTVMSMNPAAAAFFGWRGARRGLIQFVPHHSVPFLLEVIMPRLIETGSWEGDIGLLRHDGAEVPHHVTLRRRTEAADGDDYWWAIARDLTMAHRAAEADALARLNAAKDQFIASVSHELRTPLTSIRGFADIASSGNASAEEIAEYIEVIRRDAYAMSDIVDDLLVAARVETGWLSIVPRRVEVKKLVDDVAAAVPAAGTRIANRVSAETAALADEMRCRQVVRNLLTNSIRHGGSRRWVEAETVDDRVLIHICDDGMGVEASMHSSMFEAYVSRPHDAIRPESVGLGLTVSRQLARLMGGDVVYSHPGHTRFTLILPAPS